MDVSAGAAPNAAALRRAAVREGVALRSLAVPALACVVLLVYGPILWMLYASFQSPEGPTLKHYAQLLDANNLRYLRTTFEISAVVTALCVVLAYPAAYALVLLPARVASICMLFVVIPFLTSILVRTYSWLVLLQRRGLVNTFLVQWGIVESPVQLVYNYTGTVIGMVHVLLPLTLIPLYAAFQGIDRGLLKAAASLGAGPIKAFWTVFVPLSLPALAGAAAMTFVLALGFYVTPAVLGGGRLVLWATLVETTVNFNPDWGAASALGIALLAITLAILYLAKRAFGAAGRG